MRGSFNNRIDQLSKVIKGRFSILLVKRQQDFSKTHMTSIVTALDALFGLTVIYPQNCTIFLVSNNFLCLYGGNSSSLGKISLYFPSPEALGS